MMFSIEGPCPEELTCGYTRDRTRIVMKFTPHMWGRKTKTFRDKEGFLHSGWSEELGKRRIPNVPTHPP